jgi:succinoglycan biosynthesis protein ExoM
MLKQALTSLLAQNVPEGWRLSIVVIENDAEPKFAETVHELADGSAIEVYYDTEPEQGIPIARNRSLEVALKQNPDWIAFFDDDEFAPPNWIASYCEAIDDFDAEMFKGPVFLQYPENFPTWMNKRHRKAGKTGTKAQVITTSNSAISARIVSSDGMGLRFDENMRYTGCSDVDFFNRAAKLGVKAANVSEAFVQEEMPAVRSTLRWQLRWTTRLAATHYYISRKHEPLLKVVMLEIFDIIWFVFRGLYGLILTALCFPAYRRVSKSLGYQSLSELARATGRICGLLGLKINPYKQIDGH